LSIVLGAVFFFLTEENSRKNVPPPLKGQKKFMAPQTPPLMGLFSVSPLGLQPKRKKPTLPEPPRRPPLKFKGPPARAPHSLRLPRPLSMGVPLPRPRMFSSPQRNNKPPGEEKFFPPLEKGRTNKPVEKPQTEKTRKSLENNPCPSSLENLDPLKKTNPTKRCFPPLKTWAKTAAGQNGPRGPPPGDLFPP